MHEATGRRPVGPRRSCDGRRTEAPLRPESWPLTYSAEDYLDDSYTSPLLNWARRYVREQIDDLRCFCGDGTAIARPKSGGLVEVYLGFFSTKDVPGRAEMLVHE